MFMHHHHDISWVFLFIEFQARAEMKTWPRDFSPVNAKATGWKVVVSHSESNKQSRKYLVFDLLVHFTIFPFLSYFTESFPLAYYYRVGMLFTAQFSSVWYYILIKWRKVHDTCQTEQKKKMRTTIWLMNVRRKSFFALENISRNDRSAQFDFSRSRNIAKLLRLVIKKRDKGSLSL